MINLKILKYKIKSNLKSFRVNKKRTCPEIFQFIHLETLKKDHIVATLKNIPQFYKLYYRVDNFAYFIEFGPKMSKSLLNV